MVMMRGKDEGPSPFPEMIGHMYIPRHAPCTTPCSAITHTCTGTGRTGRGSRTEPNQRPGRKVAFSPLPCCGAAPTSVSSRDDTQQCPAAAATAEHHAAAVPPPRTTAAAAIASRYAWRRSRTRCIVAFPCWISIRHSFLLYNDTRAYSLLECISRFKFCPNKCVLPGTSDGYVGLCCLRMEIFSISFM
jgi:hypothetical protein